MDNIAETRAYRFDGFAIDLDAGVLLKSLSEGEAVPLPIGSRAFDILRLFITRSGAVLSKREIMDAVWPIVAVEDNNLTVQISVLRRVLDAGRANGSCIQTIPGRGYRFVPRVTAADEAASGSNERGHDRSLEPPSPRSEEPADFLPRDRVRGQSPSAGAPPLSIVVLPFQNLSGDPNEDYLAEGITDDLTSDLSRVPQATVIASTSARTYKGRAVDARQIGQELGVHYMLEGSVRRVGPALRVNAQLIDTGTGAHVWSDRFDQPIADLANGQDAILARLRGALGISLVEIEVARRQREPASTPDAFDLILRARALSNQGNNEAREKRIKDLYEEALRLDPSSVQALTELAVSFAQDSSFESGWDSFEQRQRAEMMLLRATELAPESEAVLRATAIWHHYLPGGCQQTRVTARKLIDRFPNNPIGYTRLGWCESLSGHPEKEIVLIQQAIRLNPVGPNLDYRYRRMGIAAVLAGRDEQAILWLEHALALNPNDHKQALYQTYQYLAVACQRAGRTEQARQAVAASAKAWPFGTARGVGTVFVQGGRFSEDLRLAGARDHADEDADFGTPPDGGLHTGNVGLTPLTVPGATVIRTPDLPRLIAERSPIIVDPLSYFRGRALPGTIGLYYAGLGGSVSDGAQDRLRKVMAEVTGGETTKPIVAVGWNSERYDGRNLALRLVALGYSNVIWYRGGRESWEVAGLPETEVVPREW